MSTWENRIRYFQSRVRFFCKGSPVVKIKAQTEEILQCLQSGRSITPLEALEKYGCFRLSGRIYDLKQQGHNIVTDMVTKNGKRFASYRLEK